MKNATFILMLTVVCGLATVTSEVHELKGFDRDTQFNRRSDDDEPYIGVELTVDQEFCDAPITKETLMQNRQTKDLPIGRQGTSYHQGRGPVPLDLAPPASDHLASRIGNIVESTRIMDTAGPPKAGLDIPRPTHADAAPNPAPEARATSSRSRL